MMETKNGAGADAALPSQDARAVTMCLCGDVMTGRGIDEILPHPGNPMLHEPLVTDARQYVELAEQAHGPIPRSTDYAYVWGDALAAMKRCAPDVRIINLETSITTSHDYWRGKEIHYRMHPDNVACLASAHIDCCCLANNHILDWGYAGLAETLRTLHRVGIQTAGAGMNLSEAQAPAVFDIGGKGRILVFCFGCQTSGVPARWAATPNAPGVNRLADMSVATIRRIAEWVADVKRDRDIAVASIHWGGNWGYDVRQTQQEFAHRLIDQAQIDVVYGHSSHHVKGIEVYRDRLILYGCGDLLTDYEGIRGHESFRDDLGLLYFPRVEPSSGRLLALDMFPTQIDRMRLRRPLDDNRLWLKDLLDREGARFGTWVNSHTQNDALSLCWNGSH